MNELFDLQAWREVTVRTMTQLGESLAGFLPKLLGMLLLLLLGWIVSRVVAAVARRLLQKLGIDRALARLPVSDSLSRAGVPAPSHVFGALLFWTLMLTFVLSAVETLGLTAVTATIDRLVAWLPNVIGAGLIVVLGLLLGRLTRNVVASTAAAADVPQASRLAAAAGGVVVVIVAVLALEQVGVDTALLVTVMAVLVGVGTATMGLAFALGSRPVITHVLAGHFLRQSLERGARVEVDGRRGTVGRVGAIETLLEDGGGSWSVPNGALLDRTIGR